MPRRKTPAAPAPAPEIDDTLPDLPDVSEILAENARLRAENDALKEEVQAPGIRDIDNPRMAGTVTVACKIPQGVRLQLQAPMKRRVPTGRGLENDYEVVDFMVFVGTPYYVFGPSMPAGGTPDGYLTPQQIEGGYALTRGIPADFWRQWLEQNKLADYVTNKMIFAYDAKSAKAAAREHHEVKSGLEPISRDTGKEGVLKDRRVPKSLNGNIARIAFDADRTAERRQFADADSD